MERPDAALPPLHVVTDDAVCARPDFVDAADAVLRAGGPGLVFHLRLPHGIGRRVYELAVDLSRRASAAGARLVVNDRLDVALASGAHGVQLGRRSLEAADARRVTPSGFLVGVSVHEAAPSPPGADWLLAGHVYPTPSHPAKPAAGVELVRELSGTGARVVAIGGIMSARVDEIRAAGAAGVAVVRGVWQAADPAAAVGEYLRAWNR